MQIKERKRSKGKGEEAGNTKKDKERKGDETNWGRKRQRKRQMESVTKCKKKSKIMEE